MRPAMTLCLAVALLPDARIRAAASLTMVKMSVEQAEAGGVLIRCRYSGPVPLPGINEFRLERTGRDGARFVPLLFGSEQSLVWPASARFDLVELHLTPVGLRDQREKTQVATVKTTARLYAEALLQPGYEYRMTWKGRQGDAESVESVRFRHQPPTDRRPVGDDSKALPMQLDLPDRFYLCEVLFRDQNALFLGQTILPRLSPRDFSMAAVSFSADGEPLEPPDPGRQRIAMRVSDSARADPSGPVPKPPLAGRTSHYGADADSRWSLRVSDMGTVADLPEKPGDVSCEMWAGTNPHYPIEAAIFRAEVLTGNVQKLRRDPVYWKERTGQIHDEVLARDSWLRAAPRRRLPVAAYVLHDEDLLAEFRYELSAWLQDPAQSLDDHISEPVAHRRQMRSHLHVILCLGDPDDLPLLERLARNESSGGYLMHFAGTIARGYGLEASADVLSRLLRRGDSATDPGELAALRQLQPGIPIRLRADEVILTLCRQMEIRPSGLGYRQAEERLLTLQPQARLTERQKLRYPTAIRNGSGCWYAPSLEIRRNAIEWLVQRLRR